MSRNGKKGVSLSRGRLLGLELLWLLCGFELFLSKILLAPKSNIKTCHFHYLPVLLKVPRYFQMIPLTRKVLMYIFLYIEMKSSTIETVSNHNTQGLAYV